MIRELLKAKLKEDAAFAIYGVTLNFLGVQVEKQRNFRVLKLYFFT